MSVTVSAARQMAGLALCAGLLAGCTGFGVSNAEEKAREGERANPGKSGATIFTAISKNSGVIEERLAPGLGRSKEEHVKTFGQPFKCVRPSQATEICGWQDSKMFEGSAGGNADLIYYVYDQHGVAFEWFYLGPYGDRTNAYDLLPAPERTP